MIVGVFSFKENICELPDVKPDARVRFYNFSTAAYDQIWFRTPSMDLKTLHLY